MTVPDAAPTRVLVIDDNPAIHDDFRKSLALAGPETERLDALEAHLFGTAPVARVRPTFVIDAELQGQDGAARLEAAQASGDPYALAFVDMRMPPGWDGLRTIERLWAIDPALQVVLCTAFSDYSWEEIAERVGATDNLLVLRKPFDQVEVLQIATALGTKWQLAREARLRVEELERLVDLRTAELREAHQRDKLRLDQLEAIVEQRTAELRKQALHDRLTGLPNRALFNDRLGDAVDRARGDPEFHFGVLFLDFDGFKVINDSLGHEMGDLLLVSIARRLSAVLRGTDVVAAGLSPATAARLGGDEFVILLAGLRATGDTATVAERLIETLAPPYSLKGHDIYCSASIGVTTSEHRYERAEDVIRDADTAMYRAKAAGKARFVCFDPEMHRLAMVRLSVENDLRRALERAELDVHYQPIMAIPDERLCGFEALVRWRHPERNWIEPKEFIPVAEETGLILPIGALVLRKVCTQLRSWQRRLPRERWPTVSVNLSRKQLSDPELLSRLDRTLAETEVDAASLVFEVTESFLVSDTDAAVVVVEELRARGFGVFVDDFGTGYSSLSCLHRFPLTGLKIDRSFVSGADRSRNHAAVVHAVVTLARNLGIPVVAEGVERSEEVALLHALACDRAQGFFFARPMDALRADRLLGEKTADLPAAPGPTRSGV